MKFEIENHFPTAGPEQVVEAILNTKLQQEMYRQLGYEEWQETERQEEADGNLLRNLQITPRVDLPGFIRTALGNSSRYRESQIWAPDRLSYAWDVEFDLSSRIHMSGQCRFTADGDGCQRVISAECKVDVPLLGGRIAAYIRGETERTQNEAAAALARHLAG